MRIQQPKPAHDPAIPRTTRSPDRYLIGGIILLAVLLRIALTLVAATHLGRTFSPDTQTYLDPALKLLATGLYPTDSAWRTPLYPMFIALVYRLAGIHPVFLIATQVLLSTASVALTYLLGARLLPRPAALIGTLLMAVSVESVTYAVYLMTETLFTFLLLAALLALVMAGETSRRGWLVSAALLMGLSVLCRPIALYFPLVPAFILVFEMRKGWAARIQDGIIYLIATALVLLPWVVRNQVLFDLSTVTTISDYNLLFYNAAAVEADLRGVSEAEVRPILDQRVYQSLAANGEQDSAANLARTEDRLAWQIIRAHPVLFVALHLKSDLNNFLPDITSLAEILGLTVGGRGTLSVLNRSGLLAAVRHYFGGALWVLWIMLPAILLTGLIYLCDLLGLFALAREKRWYALSLLVLPCVYFLSIPGPSSLPRFRVPVMPCLCLLAGLGLHATWSYLKGRGIKNKSR